MEEIHWHVYEMHVVDMESQRAFAIGCIPQVDITREYTLHVLICFWNWPRVPSCFSVIPTSINVHNSLTTMI